jgi:hypothetical protein
MNMTREEIIAKFPIKFMVTQNIIDNSDVIDHFNCIGTNSMKQVLKSIDVIPDYASWMFESGFFRINKQYIHLKSSEDMMEIKTPTEVEFTATEMSFTVLND